MDVKGYLEGEAELEDLDNKQVKNEAVESFDGKPNVVRGSGPKMPYTFLEGAMEQVVEVVGAHLNTSTMDLGLVVEVVSGKGEGETYLIHGRHRKDIKEALRDRLA